MRESIKQFVKLCAETLPLSEPICEFGSLQVCGQEGFADLRPFFRGKEYLGADMREGPGVDLILNLHDIALPSNSVGTVLLLDTLEHVEYPRRAIDEIYRILEEDGVLIMSSVMNFYIHDYPFDYWRFTPEAFRSLLKPFPVSVVGFAGDRVFPTTVVGVGFKKKAVTNIVDFNKKFDEWENYWSRVEKNRGGLLSALLPPIIYKKALKLLTK